MNRPSHKELTGKIRQAKEAAANGAILSLEPLSLACDAIELGYLVEDLGRVVIELLNEVDPECYVGERPPLKAYKTKIKGLELYEFKWPSRRFGCLTYFKFAVSQDKLWVVSLHVDRVR
jgi:hypothetical protein